MAIRSVRTLTYTCDTVAEFDEIVEKVGISYDSDSLATIESDKGTLAVSVTIEDGAYEKVDGRWDKV